MERAKESTAWPEGLKILLLGNGVITNLAEPLVQINELAAKMPILRELMTDGLEQEKQSLVVEELARQLQLMSEFNARLQQSMVQIKNILQREDSNEQ